MSKTVKVGGIDGFVCTKCGSWVPLADVADHPCDLTEKEYVPVKEQQRYSKPMTQWKAKVRRETNKLIIDGLIQHPGCCENCGVSAEETSIECHHLDYNVTDNVIFLCRACHMAYHKFREAPPQPSDEWVEQWYANYQSYPEEVSGCTDQTSTEIGSTEKPSQSTSSLAGPVLEVY